MKFSRKMCLMIILKVTKNQGFTISLEDTFFEKPQGREDGGGGQIDPPPSPYFGRSWVHTYFDSVTDSLNLFAWIGESVNSNDEIEQYIAKYSKHPSILKIK